MNTWFVRNLFDAMSHIPDVVRDFFIIRRFIYSLELIFNNQLAAEESHATRKIRAIHFIYLTKKVEKLPFYVSIAIVSTHIHHPMAKIFYFCHFEPEGPYWEAIKSRVEIVIVPQFSWLNIAQLHHYAHKADVVRLLALKILGGLYLDCDTITLRNMDDLAHHEFVMGVQQWLPGPAGGGLCNAIMMAKTNSRFASIWLREYRSFRSRGRDSRWDFHSVKLPMFLYARSPDAAHILPHDAWFFPHWSSVEFLLFSESCDDNDFRLFENQRAVHLWRNMIAERLDAWSPVDVERNKSIYARMCKTILDLLPEEERYRLTASVQNRPDKELA